MAGVRKQQVTVEAGKVQLVRHEDGRFLLTQGDTAIDVTQVLGSVNYPMGCVTLRLRMSEGRHLTVRDLEPAEPAAV